MFLCFVLMFVLFDRSDAQQVGSSEKHYIYYKFTVLSKADIFPEFSAVAVADDIQIKHYSNEDWIRSILTEDNWINAPEAPPDSRDWFLHQIRILSNCTDSLCSELHVLQRVIDCEREKLSDGSVNLRAFDEYGFDGEDFMAFDSETLQWIDKHPKAKETKIKWDQQTERIQFLKQYLKNCMNWISTFNNTKKHSPDVRVFARRAPDDHSKLVLICLVTGFYPRDVEMNIRLNRINIQNQISSGIRPNDDESFQMRSSVKIDRNHRGSYDCHVIHSSLTEPVTVEWDGTCIDCKTVFIWLVIAGAASLVLVLVLGVIGYCIYKKKKLNVCIINKIFWAGVNTAFAFGYGPNNRTKTQLKRGSRSSSKRTLITYLVVMMVETDNTYGRDDGGKRNSSEHFNHVV